MEDQERRNQLPPNAWRMPLLGALPKLGAGRLEFIETERENRGDIFKLDLGVTSLVVLCQPRHAEHVLRSNARNYQKTGPLWASIRTLIGNGLSTAEGDDWRRKRRRVGPLFSHGRLPGFVNSMNATIASMFEQWRESTDFADQVDVHPFMSRIAMSVVVEALFGTSLSEAQAARVRSAMELILDSMVTGVVTHALPAWLPVPGRKRHQRAVKKVDDVVAELLTRQGDGATPLQGTMHALGSNDAADDPSPTAQEIRDEAVTLFLAGHETTALMLSWGLLSIGKNPDVKKKLYHEIDTVLGKRVPQYEDLPQLPYCRMVLQEALRMYAPVYWMARRAVNDDEMDGFRIKAGQSVLMLSHMLHHHPEHWERPELFRPERFSVSESKRRHRLAWIPFGAGQRQCVGQEFALIEGQLVLARFVQEFTIESTRRGYPRAKASTTLLPEGGVWMKLQPRK